MTQSQIEPPVVADRTERRSGDRKRRTSRWLLLVPVVLVAAGVALILVLGGGGGGGLIDLGGDEEPSAETPPFDFRISKTAVVATVPEADPDALKQAAAPATEAVTEVVDDLYTNAFLDPANWREGDYEEIFELFGEEAGAAARSNLAVLTLGPDAGDVYESVMPERGGLWFSVLFDQEGAPDTVVTEVRFVALGERQDGTFVSLVSEGTLFLRNLDGWRITAFDLDRLDRDAKAPAPAPTDATGATGTT